MLVTAALLQDRNAIGVLDEEYDLEENANDGEVEFDVASAANCFQLNKSRGEGFLFFAELGHLKVLRKSMPTPAELDALLLRQRGAKGNLVRRGGVVRLRVVLGLAMCMVVMVVARQSTVEGLVAALRHGVCKVAAIVQGTALPCLLSFTYQFPERGKVAAAWNRRGELAVFKELEINEAMEGVQQRKPEAEPRKARQQAKVNTASPRLLMLLATAKLQVIIIFAAKKWKICASRYPMEAVNVTRIRKESKSKNAIMAGSSFHSVAPSSTRSDVCRKPVKSRRSPTKTSETCAVLSYHIAMANLALEHCGQACPVRFT